MTINPQWQEPPSGGPMTVEEYLELDQSVTDARYEYLDGVARLMSGGSVAHARIARNVANAIDEHFLSGPCTTFTSDLRTLIGTKSNGKEQYVYADITVTCDVADRRRDNQIIRSPRIIVEVLSPSTEKFDRSKKLEAYKACPSIQEIVLINQFTQAAEIYRRAEADHTTWTHAFYGPDKGIELRSIDIYIPMEEVYKGIDFDEPLVEDQLKNK